MFEGSKKLIHKKIDELKLPFFQILVKKDGKVILDYFYSTESENRQLVMYSMSKPITSVALFQLVEQGKLSLGDDVSKYLDGYDNLKLVNGEPVKEKITILNLLTMTSGLDYNLSRSAVTELIANNPNASTIDICSKFASDGLINPPGTKFQYSLSIDVAAAIIEKVSGKRFSQFVKENIFGPLEMIGSTFENNGVLAENSQQEYVFTDGKLLKQKHIYSRFFPGINYESGGAGLISTVSDYSLFIDSLANRANKILSDKLVDVLSTVYVKDTPFDEKVNEYSKSSVDYGYGCGVRVRKTDSPFKIPKGEFGWDGATGSYSLCDRENHISIVMGLAILNWPSYVKDLHLKIVEFIYKDIFNIDD